MRVEKKGFRFKKKTFIMGMLFQDYGEAAGGRLKPSAIGRVVGGT